MKNVMLIGGFGFIGSHIYHRLKAMGFQVVIVDNSYAPHGYRNIPKDAIVWDRDFTELFETKFIVDFDLIINTACISMTASESDYEENMRVNGTGLLPLVEYCVEKDIPLIHFSSGSVYGEKPFLPASEKMGMLHGVNSFYQISKTVGDGIVQLWINRHGLKANIIRPFSVWGTYGKGVVNQFVKLAKAGRPIKLDGGGEQMRNFTHVADLVDLVQIMIDEQRWGKIINGCSDEVISIAEMARIVTFYNSRQEYIETPRREFDVDATEGDATEGLVQFWWKADRSLRNVELIKEIWQVVE